MPFSSPAISRPLNVAVLYGGPSAEREVSLESGREVIASLERSGHRVTPFDPGSGPFDPAALAEFAGSGKFDVAFLALHGTFGEDGTVQRLLDRIGLPYTGSDAEASRLAFSKSAAKERFAAEWIPTPAYVLIHESDQRSRIALRAAGLGYPVVVKPDSQGSSLGVSIVRRSEELPAALDSCFQLGPFALLERYITGLEWTVGMLGPRSLPPMCVSTSRAFLDFDAKYRDEGTCVDFEGNTSSATRKRISEAASRACLALGTTGASRVDLRLDPHGQTWVLEVNTLPGFTPHSALPTAAEQVGISFDALCEQVIALALSRRSVRRAA